MKAKQMKDLLDTFEMSQRMLRELPEDKFRLLVQVVATLLKQLKEEAIRRGIWDDMKGIKA